MINARLTEEVRDVLTNLHFMWSEFAHSPDIEPGDPAEVLTAHYNGRINSKTGLPEVSKYEAWLTPEVKRTLSPGALQAKRRRMVYGAIESILDAVLEERGL